MDSVVHADYFDGRSSLRIPVRLWSKDHCLHLQGEALSLVLPLAQINIMEPVGGALRRILLGKRGYCEIPLSENLAPLLADLGYRESRIVAWQFNFKAVLAALVLSIGVVALLYRYGLPQAATWMADRIPLAVMAKASASSLETLDHQVLQASKLAPERQRQLAADFQKLLTAVPASSGYKFKIEFRSAPLLGPNAFALPDGTIILLDELVLLLKSDDETMAVLGHEIGHVIARDGMRQLIQGSLVGLITTWYIGDVSSLLASLPAAALNARYSREMESGADHYGALLLKRQGLSPGLLAAALGKLQALQGDKSQDFAYFSSHPLTTERIQQLQHQD